MLTIAIILIGWLAFDAAVLGLLIHRAHAENRSFDKEVHAMIDNTRRDMWEVK